MPELPEFLDVVDDDDQVIGKELRSTCHRDGLTHRVVHILVEVGRDRILIGRRSPDKDLYGGYWGDVAGHVSAGETYDEAAARELQEEAGIVGPLQVIGNFRKRFPNDSELCRVYYIRVDHDVTLNREEFSEEKLLSLGELRSAIASSKLQFSPAARASFNLLHLKNNSTPIKFFAPGKQYISGEWATLEGHQGLIASMNIGVSAEIRSAKKANCEFESKSLGFPATTLAWNENRDPAFSDADASRDLKFIREALAVIHEFTKIEIPVCIKTENTCVNDVSLNLSPLELGFGSSAATVVSAVAALLQAHGFQTDSAEGKNLIFKLSSIAHLRASGGLGSCYDIAASTYGGLLRYRRFETKEIMQRLEEGEPIQAVVESNWEGMFVENIPWPTGTQLLVGWTGAASSTTSLISKVIQWRQKETARYLELLSKIASATESILTGFRNGNETQILSAIKENQVLLEVLSNESEADFATPKLKLLASLANKFSGAGKISGAGGGDCGISLVFKDADADGIRESWKQNGITPVPCQVSEVGVTDLMS